MDIRIGHGYDLHRLEPIAPVGTGRPLRLGGVAIESDRGPVAHSDGDALLHAITDAILGSLGMPDIGQAFPDSDPRNESRDSADFFLSAVRLAREAGYAVVNIDSTVVLERPKIGPVKGAIRASLAALAGADLSRVNVKGKTHESIGPIGRGEAVEVHAVVLLGRVT
ncbi:MAG: 2-C-methyl-D-erythritol 2,4-cyclodiphosphate synthase [Phycisphaeraceae bacterium]|nr:2-C-methyl-D-erythritol 2,4-cyclodiphosphate synthase [Phycisphaerae bacterium]MBX3393556.1 2-C-methyl-D-erythritol 2,4-cyclodiphosphate synthase [Phycisphaeraceae bacterium]